MRVAALLQQRGMMISIKKRVELLERAACPRWESLETAAVVCSFRIEKLSEWCETGEIETKKVRGKLKILLLHNEPVFTGYKI
jgi:hypothetical protein